MWTDNQAPEPSNQLDLDWVYGYRGKGKWSNRPEEKNADYFLKQSLNTFFLFVT